MMHLGRLTLAFMSLVVMLLLVGTTRADSAAKSTSHQVRPVSRPPAAKSWRQRTNAYFSRQKDFLQYIRGGTSPVYDEPLPAHK